MQWKIGDVTITKIVELEMGGGGHVLMPQATPEAILAIPWLRPHFADDAGGLKLAIQSFLVQTPSLRIVVDTCLGNGKQHRHVPAWNGRNGPYLSDLTAAGFPPASVGMVLCTHLHADHVGWNTHLADGRWVPAFPNARYVFGRAEYDYWRTVDDPPVVADIMADSVTPVMDAGLAMLVETDARLTPEIRLIPTPGHTPGHVSVAIESRGEKALITGDFVHHPCQIAHPDWSTLADTDPAQGIATRRAMFGMLSAEPVLVIGTHFAGATARRIVRDGLTYRLDV
jgi:glyoxylase-like metal-dependent hydrolase (beta-lactamase superfamily II)